MRFELIISQKNIFGMMNFSENAIFEHLPFSVMCERITITCLKPGFYQTTDNYPNKDNPELFNYTYAISRGRDT